MKLTLNCDAIDATPVDFDWSTGYGETWEFHEASRCETCGAIVVGHGGEKHCDADDETECDGYLPENEGPMMNYYYPLPNYSGDVTEDAKRLVDLPVCIVEFLDGGAYALALTGGGMDLSWEICEAFMALGYWPPAHFCDLPLFAGRGTSKRDRHILAGARGSLRIRKNWTGYALRRLRENFKATK